MNEQQTSTNESLPSDVGAAERQRANTIKAWLMLAGFACGALIAYSIGERIAKGGLIGGFAGVALSYGVNLARRSRH